MKKFLTLVCASLIAISGAKANDMIYHDASKFPLYGSAVKNDSLTYTRLPDSLKTKIRKELYDLGTNTAGMFIRFSVVCFMDFFNSIWTRCYYWWSFSWNQCSCCHCSLSL